MKEPKELKGVATSWEDNNIINQPNPPKLPWTKAPTFVHALRPIYPVEYVAEDSVWHKCKKRLLSGEGMFSQCRGMPRQWGREGD